MSTLQELLAQANDYAELSDDMNEAQKGGGGRLLPAGYAFGRLVEYIELGMQAQEYNGQPKDPALEVQVGFALTGEGYQNDDGTPFIIRPFSFALSRNEKAKAFKLFKALNWQGTAKHFGQLLGQAFLVKIVHVQNKDKKTVSRIDLDGFLPPIDPVSKQPYPIAPARDEDLRLFLWSSPTLDAWNSLYVEGTWDDGKSKNRTQETILAAMDFAGSPLEMLLKGTGIAPAAVPAVPNTQAPAAPVAPAVAPAMPAMPVAPPTPPAV